MTLLMEYFSCVVRRKPPRRRLYGRWSDVPRAQTEPSTSTASALPTTCSASPRSARRATRPQERQRCYLRVSPGGNVNVFVVFKVLQFSTYDVTQIQKLDTSYTEVYNSKLK